MKFSKLSIFLLGALFIVGCGPSDSTESEPPLDEDVREVYKDDEGVWAKENFDLLAASDLLNDADDAASFEKMLNRDGSVNNLDLNGDGFVDYISVEEFKDRTDDQRIGVQHAPLFHCLEPAAAEICLSARSRLVG